MLDDVADFHLEVLQLTPPSNPTIISQEFCMERFRFMSEEIEEFIDAGIKGDMVGVADALADVIYVALGTAHQMGLPFQAIWDHVHRANMRKVRGETKRGNSIDARKPEGWVAPEAGIAAIILEAINDTPSKY